MSVPAWVLIAWAELRMLRRSAAAVTMAVMLPTAMGLLIVWAEHQTGQAGRGTAAGLQLTVLMTFTTYVAGTSTLVSRRVQSVLKRLRTSGTSDAAILAGILLPSVLLMTLQTVILFGASGARLPRQAWALLAAVVAGNLVAVLFAVITANWTASVELAQLTTTPLALAFFGSAFWVTSSDMRWWYLPLPGVPVMQLARLSWDEPGVTTRDGLTAVAVLLVLGMVVLPLAVRTLDWDPRR